MNDLELRRREREQNGRSTSQMTTGRRYETAMLASAGKINVPLQFYLMHSNSGPYLPSSGSTPHQY